MRERLHSITRISSMVVLTALAPALFAQGPTISDGGVLNAASFAVDPATKKAAAVAPGSLVAIFGNFPGGTNASADTIPYSASLGGITIKFNGISAPLQAVTPTDTPFPFVTAQVPFDALSSGQSTGTAQVTVTVGDQTSPAVTVPMVASQPGIFTIPATGAGNAVLVYVDTDKVAKIAAATNANLGYPTAPLARGSGGFFYATGLGALTPPIDAGTSGIDGVTHEANLKPTVTIGGVTADVLYWGPSGYPGVYQVNITVPQGAPTGNSVPFVVTSGDGKVVSNTATVAIK